VGVFEGIKIVKHKADVLFGLCNVIALWSAAYTVYLAVPHTIAGWKDFPELVIFYMFRGGS
jgi:chitin synthase